MDKKLEDILNEALAPELKEQLQEAFNTKVEGMRVEVEESVRAELANRYEHDKGQLVEAMDRMLSDVIRVHEEAKAEEITKLKEARQKVEESATATKALLRKQIASMANNSGKLINESLSKEISALRAQRTTITAKAEALAEDVAGVKSRLAENHAKHLEKINSFISKQLTKEIMEFAQDKRALVETRVKLISENREKLAETQKAFVKEAAKKVEDTVNGALTREMKQLHEDLERQRQNSFGRRIFEAVAAEFQTSYLAEGTEMRKLQKVLEGKEAEIAAVQAEVEAAEQKLTEAAKAKEAAERKIALAESRAERTKIMSELMSNLRGDKRAVMESMLETTKTSQLRASFNKLLPVVLNETRKVAPTGNKKVLNEKSAAQTTVTGDRNERVIVESQEESQENTEMAAIMRLAGVRK
jgi:hypothetical protein